MKRTPCYKCESRTADCHGSCEAYLAWSEERRQQNIEGKRHHLDAIAYDVNKAVKNRERGYRKGTRK